ncbi:protein kinase [bacterium]|nr:protein kinase [bacterium]
MKCWKTDCQTDNPDDALYCGKCGARLGDDARIQMTVGGLKTIGGDETARFPKPGDQRKHLAAGEVFAGRYEIAAVIGEGGMGVVYRARDTVTDQQVALKLIRADRLAGSDGAKRLIREGVVSRNIRHPNVIAVYDVGEVSGQPYMSMEYLEGKSLRWWIRQWINAGADCPFPIAARIVAELLAGLEAAHAAGVVHRDLKPENVILLAEPKDTEVRLKILDFGIARAPGGQASTTSIGTEGYMAPEQITAPDAAQASADVFALSVMFYELLVGVLPKGHWQPPSGGRSDVPPAVDAVIQKGMSNNPRARHQSMTEFRKAMFEALGGGGRPAQTQDVSQRVTDFSNMFTAAFTARRDASRPTGVHSGPVISNDRKGPPGPPSSRSNLGMTMWNDFLHNVTRRYADGRGRASRREFWGFTLNAIGVGVIALILDQQIASTDYTYDQPYLLYCASLALAAPSISVTARRLHDINLSGWIAALVLLPGIGLLVQLAAGAPPGHTVPNAWGPNPLSLEGAHG